MTATTQTLKFWTDFEKSLIEGDGIDIGCGPDPIKPDVRKFDVEDGDANEISKYVTEVFDFVYSSHCLEHMHKPEQALQEWWKLVKPGGHLIFLVPDEDLYEQGVWPSQYNSDHKATFTISKRKSWSSVSYNVLELANSLPNGNIINLELQDIGYDRHLLSFAKKTNTFFHKTLFKPRFMKRSWLGRMFNATSQLDKENVVAQIQCIVKKQPE